MIGNEWKLVGGPQDGLLFECEPDADDNFCIIADFRYVIRHHDKVLLFSPANDLMAEKAARVIAGIDPQLPMEGWSAAFFKTWGVANCESV